MFSTRAHMFCCLWQFTGFAGTLAVNHWYCTVASIFRCSARSTTTVAQWQTVGLSSLLFAETTREFHKFEAGTDRKRPWGFHPSDGSGKYEQTKWPLPSLCGRPLASLQHSWFLGMALCAWLWRRRICQTLEKLFPAASSSRRASLERTHFLQDAALPVTSEF